MEFFSEYGLFLAKTLTVVIAVVIILMVGAAIGARSRRAEEPKGRLKVTKLNDHLDQLRNDLRRALLDRAAFKAIRKHERRVAKERQKQDVPRRRIYVLSFKGDIAAHGVNALREEITAILTFAESGDEVVLRLESPGGMVHAYGLASSQLARLKDRKLPLTICVDKVAASGGYMMACLADRLVAAPFAVLGSIGVLVQMPNFHRLLKKNDVDFETITAGEYKTTLSTFGEITQKGRDKVKEDVEAMHELFKRWVKSHRPSVDIDRIATGETWVGLQAKERYLVDELRTSDDVLVSACQDADVYEVVYEERQTLPDRLNNVLRGSTAQVMDELSERAAAPSYFS